MEQQKQLAEEIAARHREEDKQAENAKLKLEVYERSKDLQNKQIKQLKVTCTKNDTFSNLYNKCYF